MTKLTAERTANQVIVSFTTAAETTDGGSLKGAVTAVLCRESPPSSSKNPTCANPVRRAPVVPGPAQLGDDLPSSLTTGPPALLAYRVELLNPRNRSAGLSIPVYALSGAAPPPAGPIAVSLRRNGALITWTPASPAEAPMNLHRTLVATVAGPVQPPHKQSAKSNPAPDAAKQSPTELTLAAEGHSATDPGGLIDRTVHDGDTVTYTAQRVRTISLPIPAAAYIARSGKPTETKPSIETLELRGEPSAPVTFAFHDTLPPSIPTGLAGIPGGGFGQPASIDLSWEANPELDLLGYNIYRADSGANPHFTQLNPEPAPGPAYRDLTAQLNHIYLYRVTAVDQRHNESEPSAPVPERLNP